ncbi:hypothetical protein [Roseibium sp.]|uniref:hypothetical protein n=1 Tax=Roseibium sp. TaxID=1936156 RepID=UPI003A96FAA8
MLVRHPTTLIRSVIAGLDPVIHSVAVLLSRGVMSTPRRHGMAPMVEPWDDAGGC